MHRKFFNWLSTKQSLSPENLSELSSFLKTNFIRQFNTGLDLSRLISVMQVHEFFDQTVIFEQGQSINRYYFLLSGRVFMERRASKIHEKPAIQILDGLNIVGQYFYDSSSSRRSAKAESIPEENPTLLLSIDKGTFDLFYHAHIQEYNQLKVQCSQMTSISVDTLQGKGLYRSMSWARFRFGDTISPSFFGSSICIILKGECIIKSVSGLLNLIEGDYLNLQGYFSRKQRQTICKYWVKSSQLILCILPFQFLDTLPQVFISKLCFIHECHDEASIIQIPVISNRSEIIKPQVPTKKFKVTLPNVQRKSTPFSSQGKSLQFAAQFVQRISFKHKPRRNRSIIDRKQTLLEEINCFRKRYCLGYSSQQQLKNRQRQQVREPQGYFNMPSIHKQKSQKSNDSIDFKRREWVSYVKPQQQISELKSNSKGKKRNKENMTDLRKGQRLRSIFDKYNTLQSFDRFGQSQEIKKAAIRGKAHLFQFPARKK